MPCKPSPVPTPPIPLPAGITIPALPVPPAFHPEACCKLPALPAIPPIPPFPPLLINQAFAVALEHALEGVTAALDSVGLPCPKE